MNPAMELDSRQRAMRSGQRNLRSRQRGVVLIFSLIILLILTIGAVALMRSMNNSLFGAGNLAFRRDLVNQSEQAIANVLVEFKTGGALVGLTTANVQASNYSATILPTNAQGVPTALLDNGVFGTVGTAANDITGATPDVQIRYVIDRLCAAGTVLPTPTACVQSISSPPGGTALPNAPVTAPSATVYRLSVRVSGPRSTQVFLQTTFSMPGS
jgi:Tfp pilus assembly protein PilX